jgi:hypothetical protein
MSSCRKDRRRHAAKRRSPPGAHERAQGRHRRAIGVPALEGRRRSAGPGRDGRAGRHGVSSVGDLRAGRRLPQHVCQALRLFPILPLGGGRRASSRSMSATSRKPSADCLANGAAPLARLTISVGRRSTRCANWSSTPPNWSASRAASSISGRWLGLPAGRPAVAAAEAAAVAGQPALDGSRQRHRWHA